VTAGPAPVVPPAGAAVSPPAGPRPLAVGAVAALVAQVVLVGATTVTSVAIARLLGPSGTGAVALVVNLIGFGTLLFGLGLRSGIIYELNSGGWRVRDAARVTALVAVALGVAGGAVVLLVYALTKGSVLAGLDATTAVAAAAALPFGIAVIYVSAIALARDRYEAYATLQGLPPMATLVFAVGLAIPFGVGGAAAGIALAMAVSALAGWAWLWRYAGRDSSPGAAGGRLRGALRFGVQAWGGDLLQFLNYRMDLFILNSVAVIANVGVYSVAVTLTSLAWIIPSALTTVLFPRAATLEAATRSGKVPVAEADAVAVKAVRQTVILLVPGAVVSLVLLLVAVPLLYGPRFEHSIVLGLLLFPGVLAIGFGKSLSAVTTGRGHPRYALYLSLISFPLTFLLYLALIPPLHATGAAIATTISYVVTTVAALVFFRRVTRLPLRTLAPESADLRETLGAMFSAVRALRTGLARR
jgi:O-antigen/teichoic acid export membrane protein